MCIAPRRSLLLLTLTTIAACSRTTQPEPPGPPVEVTRISSVPAAVTVGSSLADSLVVKVADSKGRGVPNVSVTWAVTVGLGSISPGVVVTDDRGLARAAWTIGARAGDQSATATVVTVNGPVVQTFATTASPGPAAVVQLFPALVDLSVGGARQLSASVADQFGNPITGRAIAWESSAPTIVEVSQSGLATAKASGLAEVTASVDGVKGRTSVRVAHTLATALRFDGTDDYVQIADDPRLDFGTGDFTWEVWVKRNRTGVREDILSKKDVFADSEHDLVLLIESNGMAEVFLRETLFGTGAMSVRSTTSIGTNWTHLAATRSGGVVSLYVNGVRERSTTIPFNVSSTGPLRIGANRGNNAGADAFPVFLFAGQIGEVRIWNVARTEQQIRETMTTCIKPGTTGLMAYYPLNDGSGQTARDASGNGLHGTLRNGPTWVGGPGDCGR